MPPNDFYVGSEYKRRGSPTKETVSLPIRREIEEPEGFVLTPRDKDLHHSVFGPVVIMLCSTSFSGIVRWEMVWLIISI
jgi:hypothetical protein